MKFGLEKKVVLKCLKTTKLEEHKGYFQLIDSGNLTV